MNNFKKEFDKTGFCIIKKNFDKYFDKNGKIRRIEKLYNKGENLQNIVSAFDLIVLLIVIYSIAECVGKGFLRSLLSKASFRSVTASRIV